MGRILTVFGTMFLVVGCAMPVGVQMASYAIQGISLAATNKTLTDHGISAIAEKDCALWRGLKGDPVCEEGDAVDGMIAVAAADTDSDTDAVETDVVADRDDGSAGIAASWSDTAPKTAPETHVDVVELADFSTAAGDSDKVVVTPVAVLPVAVQPSASVESLAPVTSAPVTSTGEAVPGDLYFIIGSFRTDKRARHLVSIHPDLSPVVVGAMVDGRAVYRVAVGPFAPTDQILERQRLRAAGITSSWALPYDPAAWALQEASSAVDVNVAQLVE